MPEVHFFLAHCHTLHHIARVMTTQTPLKERGTTGLIQYVVDGSDRLRGARLGKALRIVNARYNSWAAKVAFTKAVSSAVHRTLAA